jgi:DNA-directed RNA polymerase specialized sigma54-like protein
LKKKEKTIPDDQLAEILKKRLSIARRTIAKYREQLDIPENEEEDVKLLISDSVL